MPLNTAGGSGVRGLGLMNTPSPSPLLGWRVAPAPRHSRRAYVAETRASTSTAQQVPKQAVECSRARVYPRVGTPPHARSPQISLTPPPSWTARGCVSRIWGRSGGDLGEIWGDLGQIWGRSGEIWGRSGEIWGRSSASGRRAPPRGSLAASPQPPRTRRRCPRRSRPCCRAAARR